MHQIEYFLYIFILYSLQRNRRILLIWQLTIPFIYLFNFSYFIYHSFLLYNMWMLILWVICMCKSQTTIEKIYFYFIY